MFSTFSTAGRCPPRPTLAGAHTALMCMAGVNGLDGRMRQEADIVGKMVGGEFPSRGRVLDFFEDKSPGKNPSAMLPALPGLPLEAVYALIAHYRASQPAPAPAAPGIPAAGAGRPAKGPLPRGRRQRSCPYGSTWLSIALWRRSMFATTYRSFNSLRTSSTSRSWT